MNAEISLTPQLRRLRCGHEVRAEMVIHATIRLDSGATSEIELCPICIPVSSTFSTEGPVVSIRTAR